MLNISKISLLNSGDSWPFGCSPFPAGISLELHPDFVVASQGSTFRFRKLISSVDSEGDMTLGDELSLIKLKKKTDFHENKINS